MLWPMFAPFEEYEFEYWCPKIIPYYFLTDLFEEDDAILAARFPMFAGPAVMPWLFS